jgi:predicted nucleotidyltransferase
MGSLADARSPEGVELARPLLRGSLDRLPEIAARHRVLLLVLFGSTVKERRHGHSDLDLAVLFDAPPPEDDWIAAECDLEDELQRVLVPACPLDLVVLNRALPLLLREVADHGRVLYADCPGRWTAFRIHVRKVYEDTEKYRRRRWQAVLRDYGPLDAADPPREDRAAS